MAEQYTTVTQQGYGSKIGSTIFFALVGFVVLLVGAGVLFWNEGRAVHREKDLDEGEKSVVVIKSDQVDQQNEKKLVYLTGSTVVNAPIQDADFGVSIEAIKLSREVKMYQWIESKHTKKKDKIGGGTETTTTYTYDKGWSSNQVRSSSFHVPAGHENPTPSFANTSTYAEKVTVGAFSLPRDLVTSIGGEKPLPVTSLDGASESVKAKAKLSPDEIYIGTDPAHPQVGDLRITFSTISTGPVSIVAMQNQTSLVRYPTRTKGTLVLVETGEVPPSEMFQHAHQSNTFLTWILRIGGFFGMCIAFSMILGPIAAFSSIVPFIGRLAQSGIVIIGFLLGGISSLLIISVAWIFYRPLLGILILIAAIILLTLLVKTIRRTRPVVVEQAPPPIPPMP